MIKLTDKEEKAYNDLLQQAAKDKYLGPFVLSKKEKPVLIYAGEIVAGFFLPRREQDGRYRSGPIYVAPEYRQRGLAKDALERFFSHRKGRSYIEDSNKASIALFESIGFKKTERTYDDDDSVTLRMYLKD